MFDFLISTAHAQQAPAGAPPAGGGGMELLLFFGSIIAIWWFLVIRPQTRQQAKHREMVAALKKGDQVVTTSGMFGKVAAVEENAVTIEVAKGVKIKFLKDKVASVGDLNATPAADKPQDTKK